MNTKTTTTDRNWKGRVDSALNDKERVDSHIEIHTRWCTAIFFAVIIGLLLLEVKTPAKIKNFSSGNLFVWYNCTASAFVFAMFFGWLAEQTARSAEKKSLARVLFMVNLMSAAMYILSSLKITPCLIAINGNPLEITRFLKWFCTCPSMIYIISEITKTRERAQSIVMVDCTLLSFGLLAFITKEPYSTYCSAFALLCFSHVLYSFDSQFVHALNPSSGCKLDPVTIAVARYSTIVSWSFCKYLFILSCTCF